MKSHKHCELIKAWADGAKIQYLNLDDVWVDTLSPYWNVQIEYRIKPREFENGKWYPVICKHSGFKQVLQWNGPYHFLLNGVAFEPHDFSFIGEPLEVGFE